MSKFIILAVFSSVIIYYVFKLLIIILRDKSKIKSTFTQMNNSEPPVNKEKDRMKIDKSKIIDAEFEEIK